MAGIEKICEYSGEYPGSLMYQFKHNLIQIMPKYRQLFRGQKHELLIFNPTFQWRYKYGGYSNYDPTEMTWYTPKFEDEEEFKKWYSKTFDARVVPLYDYCLIVPGVKGNVDGKYINWTFDLSATKRKLKRMLRAEKLNVKILSMTLEEWLDKEKS